MEMKLEKSIKYIIYKIGSDAEGARIVVEGTFKDDDWSAFCDKLIDAHSCRYAVYDFQYEYAEGMRNKICFIYWAPDEAKIKVSAYQSIGAVSKNSDHTYVGQNALCKFEGGLAETAYRYRC
jgi:hypothetical protein